MIGAASAGEAINHTRVTLPLSAMSPVTRDGPMAGPDLDVTVDLKVVLSSCRSALRAHL